MRFLIFGSRATGTNKAHADLDVYVEGFDEDGPECERVEALKPFSIEEGGPLDIFCLDHIYGAWGDLSAIFDEQQHGYFRTILLEDEETLQLILANAREVSYDDLVAMCKEIDPVWRAWNAQYTKDVLDGRIVPTS